MPTKPATKKAPAKKAPAKKAPAKRISVGAIATGATATTSPATSPLAIPPLPPKTGAPTPAPGFEPLDRDQASRLSKPVGVQGASGAAVAAELQASTTIEQDFSSLAPVAAFIQGLLSAEAWSSESKGAEAWARFASTQEQLAWNATLHLATRVALTYTAAAANDPSIKTRYPELTRFLDARKALAQTAANKRKAAKKKAAKASGAPAKTGG